MKFYAIAIVSDEDGEFGLQFRAELYDDSAIAQNDCDELNREFEEDESDVRAVVIGLLADISEVLREASVGVEMV
jgi:hypothetical protein